MSESKPGTPAAAEIPAVLAGDADAVDAWYRGEFPEVWRLCTGFLATDGEEAAYDAMLHLLDRLPRWDASRGYVPWRNTVLLNFCRDRLRREETRVRAEQQTAARDWPAVLPRPDQAAESEEVARLLREALASLSLREREAFVLCELEGHRTVDCARMMQVGESSVRSLLTLARRRLRNLLGKRVPDLALPGREEELR